jgi:hypothetical protein
MLTRQESESYHIALCAATNQPPLHGYVVCPVCHGAGLLPHPLTYLRVAECYVCSHAGVIPDPNDVASIEGCGCVRAKTLSA